MKRINIPRLFLGCAIGCGIAISLSMLCAALISTQILSQEQDVLYTSVLLGMSSFIACKLATKAAPKWMASIVVCSVYFMLMLLGNLILAKPDMELIYLNLSILCGSALLSMLPAPQKRHGYQVKY